MSWTYPNAQENIDSVGACHISNGCVCILVLDSSYLTGKGICAEKEKEGDGSNLGLLCIFYQNKLFSGIKRTGIISVIL